MVHSLALAAGGVVRHEPPPNVTLDAGDARVLAELLGARKEDLLLELAEGRTDVHELDDAVRAAARRDNAVGFGELLLQYLKAYGQGEFVDRRGQNLSKPRFDNGITDTDIQGFATVLLEAIFDAAYGTPVFFVVDSEITTKYAPVAMPHEPGQSEPVTGAQERRYFKKYITPVGDTPSAVMLGAEWRLDDGSAPLTVRQVKAAQTFATLMSRGARSLTGAAFGFLGDVNIGLVVGANLAIGDNKTLFNLVQTIADVFAYRTSEFAALKALSQRAPENRESLAVLLGRLE